MFEQLPELKNNNPTHKWMKTRTIFLEITVLDALELSIMTIMNCTGRTIFNDSFQLIIQLKEHSLNERPRKMHKS